MIDAHRGAFEYDWRTRFHMPLSAIGKAMSYGEAVRHTQTLSTDPSSRIAASVAGWDYPVSREALVAMDLFDLEHMVAWASGGRKGAKPKPYPRPWLSASTRTAKPADTVTQEEIIAALRRAGHTAPLPDF